MIGTRFHRFEERSEASGTLQRCEKDTLLRARGFGGRHLWGSTGIDGLKDAIYQLPGILE